MKKIERRAFIKNTGLGLAGIGLLGLGCTAESNAPETNNEINAAGLPFKISLAQWSLHKSHFDKKMTALDFAQYTRKEFGLDAIEYVNQFFKDKAEDKDYINDLKTRADGEGIRSLLIMIDREGELGSTDKKERQAAVENHYKWVSAAKTLGCHSIRVNAAGKGTAEEVSDAAVQGLGALATYAKDYDMNVIVENHGSYSSDGKWLSTVMKKINLPNCGTLPDFGNFCIEYDDPTNYKSRKCVNDYDRYLGVKELMPYAKSVSAKAYDFNEKGEVIETDFYKMMDIVLAAGYNGYLGIEYEGQGLPEKMGIQMTINLLRKIQKAKTI